MGSRFFKRNGHRGETVVVKRVTPSGRILYDVTSILGSEAAKRHFDALKRLTELGLIRKPAPAKP